MKLDKSKHQQRRELAESMQEYLSAGGKVTEVPREMSGNESNLNLFRNSHCVDPKSPRTPLTDVVKTLEERKRTPKTKSNKQKKPQKRLIVDDFGDPVRWVWEE